ncbi:unnamed protein product [Rotaria sordida]|nr:unnamed protein product [Rotaria sordida]CAF3938255.1 unnamed protein product [Rotaria sordida]
MQQMPHCPRCHRHNHVYLYKSYDDDDLDHRLAAAEDRDDSLDRLDDRLRAIAADRFRLSGVVLLLLGGVFLGGFLRRVAGVALVVVGLVLARDRAAGLVNHAPAAACLRGATADYAAATTDLHRRVAFRADADDAHDAGRIGRLAALLHRGADGYIGEQTKFCFFIPIDSSKTYICDYKH